MDLEDLDFQIKETETQLRRLRASFKALHKDVEDANRCITTFDRIILMAQEQRTAQEQNKQSRLDHGEILQARIDEKLEEKKKLEKAIEELSKELESETTNPPLDEEWENPLLLAIQKYCRK